MPKEPKERYVRNREIYCPHCACNVVSAKLVKFLKCSQNIIKQKQSLFLSEFENIKGKKSNYKIKHICLECK